MFVALMVAAAFIQIPFYPVPLSFQTAIAVLSGLLLGWKKGVISMTVYMVMGLAGLPFFTAGGGIFYVFKPTFGYILGFIAAAGVGGAIVRGSNSLVRYIIAAIAACLADYVVGIPYCLVALHLSGVQNISTILVTGNLLYIPKDAVLSIVAAVIASKVIPAIKKIIERRAG